MDAIKSTCRYCFKNVESALNITYRNHATYVFWSWANGFDKSIFVYFETQLKGMSVC